MLEDSEEQLGIWDTSTVPSGSLLVSLKVPNHNTAAMQLCRTMLAVPGKMGDIDVRGGARGWKLNNTPEGVGKGGGEIGAY